MPKLQLLLGAAAAPLLLRFAEASDEGVPGGGASLGGAVCAAEAGVEGSAPIGVAGTEDAPPPPPLATEYAAPPWSAAAWGGGSSPLAMASATTAALLSPLAAWREWGGNHGVATTEKRTSGMEVRDRAAVLMAVKR